MSNETISVPRDWAQHYADLLEECCAYEKSEQVSALLAQPAEPVISPGDEELSHLSTIELRGYHKGWAAASVAWLAETKRLKGLLPEWPPRPPEGEGLPRYGLRWDGPQQPLATPMDDGYWTPWHLANELRKDAERYQWLRSRDLETISHGGVFAGITPQNLVLNEETLDEAIDAARAQEAL